MYPRHVILYLLLFLSRLIYNQGEFFSLDRPRVWSRLPPFFVKERVYTFMNENLLTNCFEYREKPNMLLLKCWSNNKLKNVKIEIEDTKNRKKNYYLQYITS